MACWRVAHRLQLRGQPRRCTAFPFHLPLGRTIAATYTRRGPERREENITADITLVLGGARSGKSRHAESLLAGHAPRLYIATAQAFDDEMRDRIAAHRASRAGWHTIEAPIDLPAALLSDPAAPALVDCLTLWLTNLILADDDLAGSFAALDRALAARSAETILVSNEVGLGIVPDNPLARRFRDEAGRLHQHLAAQAAAVLLLVAGIPLRVK